MVSFILKGVTATGKELGRGAYGTVFKVMYCGTKYAAKEIHSMCNGESGIMVKELKDEFLRECCLRSKCLHPNIVQFIGMYHPMANNVNPQVTDQLYETKFDHNYIRSYIQHHQKVKLYS